MRNIVNGLLVRQGTVLLAKRSLHRKAYPGLWSFPGGHVEENEPLLEALARELREEIGIVPTTTASVVGKCNSEKRGSRLGGSAPPPVRYSSPVSFGDPMQAISSKADARGNSSVTPPLCDRMIALNKTFLPAFMHLRTDQSGPHLFCSSLVR
jgi:NUDIX domain